MEDSPMFNAGKGVVFTHEGINELDAAIMDGSDLSAGAVAGVTDIRNPISAARKVMEASPHVMLSGKSITWGEASMTFLAAEIGLRMSVTPATAPAERSLPSIIAASSSLMPS